MEFHSSPVRSLLFFFGLKNAVIKVKSKQQHDFGKFFFGEVRGTTSFLGNLIPFLPGILSSILTKHTSAYLTFACASLLVSKLFSPGAASCIHRAAGRMGRHMKPGLVTQDWIHPNYRESS